MIYPAHIRRDENGCVQEVQTVEVHCRNCARLAAQEAPPGMVQTAYLCGLLHDMGKYTLAFARYIEQASRDESVRRGSVNHTFAGARFALERWHTPPSGSLRDLTSELIAFAAGSHHGQFDCIDEDGKDGYQHRQTAADIGYGEAKAAFLSRCATEAELDTLFMAAVEEMAQAMERFRPIAGTDEEMLFQYAMLSRQILSAVIDGDRRDTAEFCLGISIPHQVKEESALWQRCLRKVENRLQSFTDESEINRARRTISDRCKAAAKWGAGIYRLNIPTGGGKTLAALRYALATAAEHEKQRIIFVIPLLSILDQNAKVIREYLDDDRLILEHHSNVIQEKSGDKLDENELLMETWAAPVVITTLVQLLNTLFSGKPSCIRRMAALRDSVIVIDEVQSVPRTMLSPFNMALNYLSAFCGATILLCSATQPCLEQTAHPLLLARPSDLVAYDAALWKAFRRTEIFDKRIPGGYSTEELAAFVSRCADEQGSVLLICNTKAEALGLYRQLRLQPGTFHLSTAMCMEHRLRTLQAIHAALHDHERVVCISTQLVEAGVDFSFGCVIRILAGMDNVVQAAGRCNRNGEHAECGPVYLVNLREERLSRLPEIWQAQKAAESLLADFAENPAAFEGELTSDTAIRAYYRALYAEMDNGGQDYPLPELGTSLLDLLSVNRVFRSRCQTAGAYILGQAFQTAGKRFRVFEDNTTDVLVPFGEGAQLIAALCSDKARWDLVHRGEQLKKAGRYTVCLYQYQLDKLRENGGVYSLCDGTILALQPEFYAEETGLCLEGENEQFLEV